MERMGSGMRIKKARPVGSGYRCSSFRNQEGYPDPTASCAIAGLQKTRSPETEVKPAYKEKTVHGKIHPISQMARDLSALGKQGHREGGWKAGRDDEQRETDHTGDD